MAIHYDLFACTPLLLTVSVMLARHYGEQGEQDEHPFVALLKVPPLWAAIAGVILNLAGVPIPAWIEGFLEKIAPSVAPLMLIALGMGLRWDTLKSRQMLLLWPVLVIQLLAMPLLALGIATVGGLEPRLVAAITLEAAMPSMVLGVVLCDRYRLDPALYAGAVTLSTVLSLLTLPLWLQWLL